MANNPNKQVTLKDIAAATGYSVNAVSRALRGKDDISKETTEKIKRAASEMGYVNNMIASSLRLGYTNLRLSPANTIVERMGDASSTATIAVILGDISRIDFGIAMKEIEQHARFLGYASLLFNTNESDLVEREAIRMALNKNVDGMILCPNQKSEDNVRFLKENGIPFVLLSGRFPGMETDYIVCNDKLGGYIATQYLLEFGHRDILMINGPEHLANAQERVEGYRRAHEDAGVSFQRNLIRSVGIDGEGCTAIIESLLDRSLSCTAILAYNDIIAWKLWAEITRHGIKVPDDYSLIGCDYMPSRLALPAQMHSVNCFREKMAVAAVDILVSKLRGGKREMAQVMINSELVYGNTVAAPENPVERHVGTSATTAKGCASQVTMARPHK